MDLFDATLKVYAAVVGTLGLVFSLYALWESLGANVVVTAQADESRLRLRIFNRGRRKVRIDSIRFWYGTSDFRTTLLLLSVDETLAECDHHDRLIPRDDFVQAAAAKSLAPLGHALLRLDVSVQGLWFRRHAIVDCHETLLDESHRRLAIAPYIAANAFLKIALLTSSLSRAAFTTHK